MFSPNDNPSFPYISTVVSSSVAIVAMSKESKSSVKSTLYSYVPVSKLGFNVNPFISKEDNPNSSFELVVAVVPASPLVTSIVYVCVVPFYAVTWTTIVFFPFFNCVFPVPVTFALSLVASA